MSQLADQNSGSKRKGINREAFGGITILAVFIAAVLVGLGVVSSSAHETYIPDIDPTSIGETSMGSPDAPILMIEFSDFQCSHCQQYALTIAPDLEAAYIETGKVRLVHKFVIGYEEESLLANEAALCAAEQGQFWPYYFLLMQQRAFPTVDDLSVEKLQGLAQKLGLDMDTFNTSLLSGKFESIIRQDDEECRAVGITKIPFFIINDVTMAGASSFQDFKDIIDPILEELDS